MTLLGVGGAVLAPTTAESQVGGPEFQVNSYTGNEQRVPRVTTAPDSGFVVVWQSFGSDGTDDSRWSVQSQRFAADGNTVGSEFQVNSYTLGYQDYPAVAVGPGGEFAVVWQKPSVTFGDSHPVDTIVSWDIQGQRHDAAGNAVGSEFRINSYTTGYQRLPRVAATSDGDFVVVWQSNGACHYYSQQACRDRGAYSIQGQRFGGDGNAIGSEFQVNSYTTTFTRYPSLASGPDGGFVVVWLQYDPGTDWATWGQRYDASGSSMGDPLQIGISEGNGLVFPEVAAAPGGEFVVVWHAYPSQSSDSYIEGQRFGADGGPLGSPFHIDNLTSGSQRNPVVAIDSDGDFVVAWFESPADDLRGQRFDAEGNPLAAEFQINTSPSAKVPFSIAAAPGGDFVVAWSSGVSSGTDTDGDSIQGRRFRVTGDLGNRVWDDLDLDGIQDDGEPGVPNVTVHLRNVVGDLIRTTSTDADGHFDLEAKAGSWVLEFEAPAPYAFTVLNAGGDPTLDSDADPATGQTGDIVVAEGIDQMQWDAGLSKGLIFADDFESSDTSAWK